jgi:hypothetical protein
MELFAESSTRLSQFLQDRGLPPRKMCVDWGDVIVKNGRFYVYRSRTKDRAASAEARFQEAAKRGVGVCLEAICTVKDATCTFVYLPSNDDEADQHWIPASGVKLSVPTDPREARLVSNPIVWAFLKLRAVDYLKVWHC